MASATEIIPCLWVGPAKSAQDIEFLRSAGIHTVVNCTRELPFAECDTVKNHYRLAVDDNGDHSQVEIMIREAPALALSAMEHIQKGEPVLIHCSAGRQRSAALAAITLMKLNKISAEEAMATIRAARPEAFFPQANFAAAIIP